MIQSIIEFQLLYKFLTSGLLVNILG